IAGETGRSLVINLAGPRKGRWSDFAEGRGGDSVDLIAATRCGGDVSKALAWGLGEFLRLPCSRIERPGRRAESKPQHGYRDAVEGVWREARPLRRGDMVDRYLAERGSSLAELGQAPRALRYHDGLWHSRVQARLPAMVAAISSPSGGLPAVHRTYLASEN